mmetsp:Transcript_6482/g.24463  ORF Transcript_6482/g.24463 Transcript_6482/m.24463 type:complete len:296 (-) Transcript_6482:145-1032(-)
MNRRTPAVRDAYDRPPTELPVGVLNFLNSADSSRSCAAAFTSKAVTFVGLSEGLCVCPSRPNEFRLALTSPSAPLTTETACGAYSFMESTDATSIPTPSQSALRMSICRWNFTRNWVCATPAVCETASSPFANDAGAVSSGLPLPSVSSPSASKLNSALTPLVSLSRNASSRRYVTGALYDAMVGPVGEPLSSTCRMSAKLVSRNPCHSSVSPIASRLLTSPEGSSTMEDVMGCGSSKFTATHTTGVADAPLCDASTHRRTCRKSRDRERTPMPSVLDMMDGERQAKRSVRAIRY